MRTGSCPWLLRALLSVSAALALVALAACVCVFRYRAALQKLQKSSVEATSSTKVTTQVANPENFSGQQVLPSVESANMMSSALDPGTGLHTFLGIRRSWLVWPRTIPSDDDEIISISYDLSTTDKSSEPGAFDNAIDSGSDAREEQPESPGVSTPRGTLRHRLGAHFSSRRQAATEGLPSDHQARRAEYKAAKRTLRDFERAFESQHSRKPRYKKDWDPVYDVYLRYEALRREESPRSAEHAVVLSRPRAELIVAAATSAAATTAAAAAAASIPAPRGGQNLGQNLVACIWVPKTASIAGAAAAYLQPTCVLASSAPRHCASPLVTPLGHRDSGAGVGARVVDAEVRAAPEIGHEIGSRSARAERAKKEAALSDARSGPSRQLARTCDRCGRRACTCERLSL